MTSVLVPALLYFDPSAEKDAKQSVKLKPSSKSKKEKRLFCAACRYPITHQDERIAVQGGHEHTFTNPHGVTYHIGCFREAVGCTTIGESSLEYTWFKGYAWRIAICVHCRAHLGWLFEADDFFHGLIVNRLTSTGPVEN